MHADFHELSEVAAGRRRQGDHVRGCSVCREELARLRSLGDGLRALPSFAPPADGWSGARHRAGRQDSVNAPGPLAYAVAASLLAVLAAALLFAGQPAGVATSHAGPQQPTLDGLMAENARLESYLAQLPQPRTARVGTAYTIATIEDRLALVDDSITTVALQPHAPEVAEALWRERLTLMNSLARVRFSNAVVSR